MKLLLSGFALFIILLSFSSCMKSFTCECTFSDTTKNFTVKLDNMTKNDATVTCEDYNQFVGDCALK